MEDLIKTIQLAVAEDATDEARAAGAGACRAILTALDAQPGGVLVPAAMPSVDPSMALDLIIGKLRAIVSTRDETAPARPTSAYRVELVPIPTSDQEGEQQ